MVRELKKDSFSREWSGEKYQGDCQASFDLVFEISSDEDDSAGSSAQISLPREESSSSLPEILAPKRRKPRERSSKQPILETVAEGLTVKTFAPETRKKIRWAITMYTDFRLQRNKNPDLCKITADLDEVSTLSV